MDILENRFPFFENQESDFLVWWYRMRSFSVSEISWTGCNLMTNSTSTEYGFTIGSDYKFLREFGGTKWNSGFFDQSVDISTSHKNIPVLSILFCLFQFLCTNKFGIYSYHRSSYQISLTGKGFLEFSAVSHLYLHFDIISGSLYYT
jgi:hypothetical protein